MNFNNFFFDTKHFKLTDTKLGKGSFGTVYIAERLSDHSQFAAKIIHFNSDIDGRNQMNIMRESTILSTLLHRSIIKFCGLNFRSLKDPSKFQPTIITEYMPNKSLKEILEKERSGLADDKWSPTKKYICLIGISDAMRYLHKKNILHLDLKPENILMDENYYPKISDFGLSRFLPNLSSGLINKSLTGKIGTPLYMAPELISDDDDNEEENDEKYGKGIDVYAFSIIAYEIVTGKKPFSEFGDNISKIWQSISNGVRPSFSDDVPQKMKDLISKCWSQKAKDRPSFEEIFDILSNDFSCSPEDVDEIEIRNYLESDEDGTKDDVVDESPQLSKVLKKLKKIERKNKEIKKSLEEMEEENDNLTNENRDLKKENKEMKAQIKEINKELNLLKEENLKLKEENEKAHILIDEKKKQSKKLETKNDSITPVDFENISISQFNTLSLQSQQDFISQIKTNSKNKQYFMPINAILAYILNFVKKESTYFLRITSDDDDNKDISEIDDKSQIHLLPNYIDFLYNNNSLNSREFRNILKQFKNNIVFASITYPSKYFDDVYDIISEQGIMEIEVFITKTKEIKEYLYDFNIASVVIDFDVSVIGKNAFRNCKTIQQITIPDSVLRIDSGSFINCKSLEEIEIPSSVKIIYLNCFEKCSNLKKITFKSKDTKILSDRILYDKYPMNFLKSLEFLTFPLINSLNIDQSKQNPLYSGSNLYSSLFNNFDGTTQMSIFFMLLQIETNKSTNKGNLNNSQINLVFQLLKNISEKMNYTENIDFNYISIARKDVLINYKVVNIILEEAFSSEFNNHSSSDSENEEESNDYDDDDNSHLENVSTVLCNILPPMNNFKKDNFLNLFFVLEYPSNFNKDLYDILAGKSKIYHFCLGIFITGISTTDLCFQRDENIKYVKLDNTVKKIAGYKRKGSFEGCSSLTKIEIPTSVTEIGRYAFYGCKSLHTLYLPSSLKLKRKLAGIKAKFNYY